MVDNLILSDKFQKCTLLISKITISRRKEMKDFNDFSKNNE